MGGSSGSVDVFWGSVGRIMHSFTTVGVIWSLHTYPERQQLAGITRLLSRPPARPPTQPPTHQPTCASCAQRTCAAMHRCIHVGAACPCATLQPHHVGGQQEAQSVTRQAAGDWPAWQGVGCGGAPPDQQQWQERHPQLLRSRQCHPGGCGHQVCDRHHRPAQALQGAHLLVLPRRSRLRLPSSTQCSSSTVALVGRL